MNLARFLRLLNQHSRVFLKVKVGVTNGKLRYLQSGECNNWSFGNRLSANYKNLCRNLAKDSLQSSTMFYLLSSNVNMIVRLKQYKC